MKLGTQKGTIILTTTHLQLHIRITQNNKVSNSQHLSSHGKHLGQLSHRSLRFRGSHRDASLSAEGVKGLEIRAWRV